MHGVIIPHIGSKTTYLHQLKGVGQILFGSNFAGVFPSDKIPKLNDSNKYAILNLDSSKMPGSHWVAIANDNGITYFYDSFGRPHTKIIKNLPGKIVNTELDPEQSILETNCGARSLAWLYLFDRFGSEYAIEI